MTRKELLSIAYAHGRLIVRKVTAGATVHASGDVTREVQVLAGAIHELQERIAALRLMHGAP